MEKLRDVYLSLILDKRQCLQPEPVSGGPYQKCLKSDVVSSRDAQPFAVHHAGKVRPCFSRLVGALKTTAV